MKKELESRSELRTRDYFWRAWVLVILSCSYFGRGTVSGQQIKKSGETVTPTANTRVAGNQDEIIGRLLGIVNELKNESDKTTASLLQAEIADILWKFDEAAARSIFRLAFDAARKISTDDSSKDPKARSEAASQSRRRAAAIKTILKQYGFHDKKGAEVWLQEFESELKDDRTAPSTGKTISQQQAELVADLAVGLVSQDPKEAQQLGLLSLSAEDIPSAFGRLLMALRGQNKALSDVLYRQAILVMRTSGFNYNSAVVSLTNYEFFSDGRPFPDASSADVDLMTQYFADAASMQATRARSGNAHTSDEQALMGQFYGFLISRAMAIVARNSPDKVALLQSNVSELAQGISVDQRQQADTLASLADQRTALLNGNDGDIESRIHRAEQEKNSSTRNFLLRNLVIQLMRRDPEQALEVTKKIDDVDLRAQAEDDVYLVLLQNAFRGASYDEAKRLALRLNDINRRAQWLAQVATQVSSRTKDRAEAIDLLSDAYSIAAKGDNTAAKLEVLLSIAKEFVLLDRERGFDILSEAAETANRLKKPEPKTNTFSGPMLKVITMTVVNGKEVSTDDTVTLDSIDFNQITPFTERDYLRTSLVGDNLKDRSLRAKYFIALARSVLHVPRQGPGYERTLEDILSGSR